MLEFVFHEINIWKPSAKSRIGKQIALGGRRPEIYHPSETDFRNQFLIPEITFYHSMNLQGSRFASRAC